MTDSRDTEPAGLRRRSVLRGAAAGAGALALGVGPLAGEARAATYIKGADISWMPQMEANGYYWNNSAGVRQDLFTILKGYGITAVSLRTWVNLSDSPDNGHCGIDETAQLAKRAKDAGMQVLIGFHFGHTWNSVGVQNPPAAWASMGYSQMLDAMYDYVYHSCNVIKYYGVTPAWVKIGNETNSGICKPVGSISNPAQMTGLLNAAYDMSKHVFPSTPVLVHAAQPQKLDSVLNFLNAYRDNGGRWDITGLSSYAQDGNVPGVLSAMQTIQSTYGKPVMQVEYGGPLNKPTQVRDSLKAFITGLRGIGGLGTIYWEPEGYSPFTSYGSGAWDPTTRRPTTALDGFLEAR
ncbi:glycosyl hydrolase 53 family protein [Streptomyces justiciae]|uniref:glycosyl hydrolase 53 family protein n=1 Tax=Streptomyces justiciae TaxID=2780140 RepID=UPI00187E6E1A|nr:glycosyl hydrolase 53 family protein [Streptomyces justiciae]MBE8474881.1 glycosyl hydrolase 53 family protein [Streptomyces justiciae]MCW8383215.1 arabinogalactan endo-1,4-beta-galactosidase [Streptomyces justiciae]